MDERLLSEEQREWQRTVRSFVEKSITREYVRRCDIDRQYPYEAYKKVADEGWLGLFVPQQYGGDDADVISKVILLQELGRFSVDFGAAFAVPTFTAENIVKHGTETQKKSLLPGFLRGDVRFSIGITEPGAGSDVAAIRTTAVHDGDGYLINGHKTFQSAAHADNNVICLLVRTDPGAERHEGMSMLLVPSDSPGITMHRLPTVARRATGTNEVYLEDVRLPHEALLGQLGDGWNLITKHLEFERLTMASIYASNGQQAVADAVAYASEREQFGRPISRFQVIRHALAQMQTDADMASMMVYRAARLAELGIPSIREVSMAKLMSAELLYKIAGEGMQILGGAAQLPDSDMERYWREGKQGMVGGGTSQIQRSIIAKTMGIR